MSMSSPAIPWRAPWSSTAAAGSVLTAPIAVMSDSQETIVTGPSKSGTAKTDGVPASTTFRIKDSNGQWVDNTNSNSGADHSGGSAQEFYVKNASGRVALARLDP